MEKTSPSSSKFERDKDVFFAVYQMAKNVFFTSSQENKMLSGLMWWDVSQFLKQESERSQETETGTNKQQNETSSLKTIKESSFFRHKKLKESFLMGKEESVTTDDGKKMRGKSCPFLLCYYVHLHCTSRHAVLMQMKRGLQFPFH